MSAVGKEGESLDDSNTLRKYPSCWIGPGGTLRCWNRDWQAWERAETAQSRSPSLQCGCDWNREGRALRKGCRPGNMPLMGNLCVTDTAF